MKRESFLWNIYVSGVLLLLGLCFLLFPLFQITDITLVFRLFLAVFAIVSVIMFVSQYKNKEYSSFSIFCISILLLIGSFLFPLTVEPKNLALSLLVWILFVSLAKIKRADFFHDRKSKIWCLEISLFFLFFLNGVCTCVNFAFSEVTSVLCFGYFTFLYGVLEIQESLLLYFTKGKLK